MRRVLALLALLASPLAAQEAEGPPTAEQAGDAYVAWRETAERAETVAEAGRGSPFALAQLRESLVEWRATFEAEMAANAARIATVESQLAALGEPPAEGAAPEDPRLAARRAELMDDLARLRAPGRLAAEAYAHADGLVGELDALIRGRQAAELLSRSQTPLDPRLWPAMGDAVTTRAVGLWKELGVSVRSRPRQEVFAAAWPGALLMVALGLGLTLAGVPGMRRLERRARDGFGRARLRGTHAANLATLAVSVAGVAVPFAGIVLLAAAVSATGLFGTRAMTLVSAVPVAAACILAAEWLAARLFDPSRANPAPFDLEPAARAVAGRRLGQAGWVLGLAVLAQAFLSVGDIEPAERAGLMWPIYALLSVVVFRFASALRAGAPPRPEDEPSVAFRRRVVAVAAQAVRAIAVAAPVLMLLGFHRMGAALLFPSVVTLGLLGLLVVLQWAAADLYAVLMRREEGLREALLPVVAGFVLLILALPLLALIWGARPEDLWEWWGRFLAGVTVGESRLSPRQFVIFALVLGAGWMLTRVVQGTLKATVLPRTRLDQGGQNAVVAGLGYLGIAAAALVAVSVAGLDLSNLAIVAGALSVGIGFGLQNIVQNFVSGLILLIERPIGEGDWIEVGGRMGYVRDISVRSTRIETFDRTDVIVPNADLVSGQVVNWTRGNLVGRLILPVSVAYGNDPDHVAGLLRGVAEAHPMVLLQPPPAVVIAGFAPDLVNFEIRAIIRDVNFGVTVRSEINREIARRFLAEGIRTGAPAQAPSPPPPA